MTEWHGVFGKLPEARDFVTRGLPGPVKRGFDRWLTQNVAGRGALWPDGGLRGLLTFETPALFVAVESQDKVGRQYPLAALTSGLGASLEEAEIWCDSVYPTLKSAAEGAASLDALACTLNAVPISHRSLDPEGDAIWIRGGDPLQPGTQTLETLGFRAT
ncbi:MAG: TagF domain-containing protein [Pseudomonadota bacterium]